MGEGAYNLIQITKNKFIEKLFMVILFHTQIFCQKPAETYYWITIFRLISQHPNHWTTASCVFSFNLMTIYNAFPTGYCPIGGNAVGCAYSLK